MDRDGENYQCTCIAVHVETLHEIQFMQGFFLSTQKRKPICNET